MLPDIPSSCKLNGMNTAEIFPAILDDELDQAVGGGISQAQALVLNASRFVC